MKDECIAAVEDALGRHLRANESKKIEDSVNLAMRLLARKDPEAWAATSPYDRLQQAATASAQAMTAEVKLKQQRVKLQIQAHDRIENAINDGFDKLPEKAKAGSMLRVVSQMLAFDAKGKGMTSVETWAHSIQNESLGRLMPLWESTKGFLHLFQDKQGIHDLVKELYGEDSGNAAAKGGADAWRQVTDELRDRANAAGMDIGKLDEWRFPQNHSQGRVAQAGLEKWTEDTLPKLDRNKYIRSDGQRMSDDEVRDFLRNAYDSIITDGQNKVKPGEGRPGYGLTANRQSAHRQIFFKDADSYTAYQGDYGDRSLWPTLTGHIRSISRDIALNEVLGPNAEQTFRYFNDRTLLDELRQDPTKDSRIRAQSAYNEALFDYVSGKRAVVNQKVADIGQSFRNFETAAKLGKVVITALGDEAGMAATAFANKVPWSAAFAREFKYMNPANSSDRAVAAHAGLGINGIIGGLNRFGYEDLQMGGGEGKAAGVRQFTSKLANGVMHASGAEAMWDARRRALGSILMSYVGKLTREVPNFQDINSQDHGVLANKGVTEDDWEVWKLAQPEDWGANARSVLTPKSIAAIPDESLRAAFGDRPIETGKTRLYRGEGPNQIQGGEWWTTDRAKAAKFAGSGKVLGLDLTPQELGTKFAQGHGGPDEHVYGGAPGDLAGRSFEDLPGAKVDVAALRRHASTMLLGHILEETGMGVMDTGARERAGMFLGTQAGTPSGELYRSALLFKSFAVSMAQKHWTRAGTMDTGMDRAWYVARLMVAGTIMGAVANQLRNLASGKDPQNIVEPQFWGESILRGGGLGFYGDFLYSEATSHDTSLIPALMGPLATESESVWNLTGGAAFKSARGERTDEGAKLLRYVKGNIPFLNMWYTQAAMDHLVWNEMQEAASPGYLDRMQTKAYANRGTSWFWDPHESLPTQPPDFAKLVQPDKGREQMRAIARAIPFEGASE